MNMLDIRRRMMLAGGGNPFPEYTYTGNSEFIDDGDGNWRIKFLTSGVFTLLDKDIDVDIFLVGGGGGACGGGAGGGGGYTKTVKNILLNKANGYSVTVGLGGQGAPYNNQYNCSNGGNSYFGNYVASGGFCGTKSKGGNGGSGGAYNAKNGGSDGSNASGTNYGTGQGSTTREFGETTGDLYSGGGGGGGVFKASGGAGGAGGGGAGGAGASAYAYNASDGSAGVANSGGGGGGGGFANTDYGTHNGNGGAGGSGIVIIRNARG